MTLNDLEFETKIDYCLQIFVVILETKIKIHVKLYVIRINITSRVTSIGEWKPYIHVCVYECAQTLEWVFSNK